MEIISTTLSDKTKTNKEKVAIIGGLILDRKIAMDGFLCLVENQTGSKKATLIESIEYATKVEPKVANLRCLEQVSNLLLEKESRVKWESARVIANIASQHCKNLKRAVDNLKQNLEDPSTVVRWSVATAFSAILAVNKDDAMVAEIVLDAERKEEKESIKKIYKRALKRVELDKHN